MGNPVFVAIIDKEERQLKVLITGAEGFIGSHLVERFLSDGHEVISIDDESAPQNEEFYKFEGAAYHKLSILDPSMSDLFVGVDVVYHHAARSRIQPSFDNARETYEVNAVGTQRVLDAAMKHGVKRVIYAGSSSCYGLQNVPPLKEDMKSDPLNHYALAKMQGEQICKLYSRIYGIETVVLRYFNVYGPREPLKGIYAPVIGIFKKQRDEGRPLTIVGDGEQSRDFTHVLDVVEANVLAASRSAKDIFSADEEAFEIFNIGSGKNYTINEVAEMVGGEKLHLPARPGEAKMTLADNSKARARLNWHPKIDLRNAWE